MKTNINKNSINGHYKHKKLVDNSRRTGGEFHVDSASYPRVMSGGHRPHVVALNQT